MVFNVKDIKKAFWRPAHPTRGRKDTTVYLNETTDSIETTESNPIKETFHDVCKELSREINEWSRENFQNCLREVRDAWPDKERCWERAEKLTLGEIDKLAKTLNASNPDLASFLRKRKAQYRRDLHAEHAEQLAGRVERANGYWPEHKDKLEEWVKSDDLTNWYEILNRVENPSAVRSIRLWLKETKDEIKLKRAEQRMASAREIVEVFPDRERIRKVLDRYLSSERKEIYKLLPDEIKELVSS